MYAGEHLEFHAFVERSIEQLFVGLLRGRLTSSVPSVRPLIAVSSDSVAHSVVSGDRTYADWLPYKRYTNRRARSFFSSGKPFTTLEKPDVEALDESLVLRNAIAHRNSSALRAFQKLLVADRHLPVSQRRPGGYLRGPHTIGQTRMNHLMSRVVAVMFRLCR